MVEFTGLISTSDLVQLFKVSRMTVNNWRKAGLPHIKAGPKTFRYRIEDLEQWFGAEIPELEEFLYIEKKINSY